METPFMKKTTLTLGFTLAIGITLGALGATALHAQGEGFKRTMLQKIDLTGVPGREVVVELAEIAPGVSAGKHRHNATEIGYVVEGSGVLMVDGEAPRPFKTGDSYHIAFGKPHDATNTGTTPLKVFVVWVAEKGKRLAVPVK